MGEGAVTKLTKTFFVCLSLSNIKNKYKEIENFEFLWLRFPEIFSLPAYLKSRCSQQLLSSRITSKHKWAEDIVSVSFRILMMMMNFHCHTVRPMGSLRVCLNKQRWTIVLQPEAHLTVEWWAKQCRCPILVAIEIFPWPWRRNTSIEMKQFICFLLIKANYFRHV